MDRYSVPQKEEPRPSLASLFQSWRELFLLDLPPDKLVHQILKVVAQTIQSTRASVMLLDHKEQTLHIEAALGLPPEVIATTSVKIGEGIAGWVAQTCRPLLLPGESDVPFSIRESLASEQIISALCVPIEVRGYVLGVLNLAREGNSSSFTHRDLWFASLIADRMAITLHNVQLHHQLETHEQFITRILESIPTSLIVIDRTYRVVAANRNFLEKAKRGIRTTLGHRIGEIFPSVLTEYTQLEQKIREVFRTGQPIEGGKVSYRAPGLSTRTYYYRLVPLKAGHMVENVMVLMDDITEREQLGAEMRRAEQHLASVVECANDLVVSMDLKGGIVTWNRAAERTSGLKFEQVKGQSIRSLCTAEHQPAMETLLSRLSRGEEIRDTEVSLLTANGQVVPIAWSCSPMRNDTGQVSGIVAVGRDLTERRQLEAQLIQSAKMASLGVMAGGIAHELRNPLGIISASAQLLLEHQDDTRLQRECAEKIHAATQRASLIIENLLKFARAHGERGREVDLHAVLDETLVLLTHQMTLQKVTLRKVLHPDLPRIHGNPEMLQQVFTNIILNACNAMDQGGILTIETRVTEAKEASSGCPTSGVEIRFTDTGHGIPPEHLSKIFDPFFTTMPVGRGTGLGLSISYSIIQQHEGTIEVESELGKGTTFIVRLPTTGGCDVSEPTPDSHCG